MRLLLVNYEYPPLGGGAATATAEIARAAARDGHGVTVLTAGLQGQVGWTQGEAVDVLRLYSRRARRDRASIAEMGSFVARAIVALPSVLRRNRPQGCIVFFSMPCGPIGLLGQSLYGIPYVISLRGGDVPGNEPTLDRMHAWLCPLRRLVLRRARAVVANSWGLARLARNADPVRVAVIPNGVDSDAFHPSPTSPASPFRFLFVGRLHAQKNIELLFDAAAEVRRRTRTAFRLLVVGDGAQRESLLRVTSTLGIDAMVDWTWWLPRDQLPNAYHSAHCLVNPSRYEGMPNAVLEAMASGLPVIVSDVDGNRDIVEHGETGLVFRADDRDALVGMMTLALSDAGLLMRLAANALHLARERYSWSATTREYIALLDQNRPGV